MSNQTFTGLYIAQMKRALDGIEATLCQERAEVDSVMDQLCVRCARLKETGGSLYFVGNGASAMMSSHMALDFSKNAGIRSMAFNDAAFLTAIGNDLEYAQSFDLPLQIYGRPGDMLATISSSGNSPSIIRAIQAARKLEMTVVTFSGMKPDNQSRSLGDINFYVPGRTYGVAESVHAILLHCWLDRLLGVKEWER